MRHRRQKKRLQSRQGVVLLLTGLLAAAGGMAAPLVARRLLTASPVARADEKKDEKHGEDVATLMIRNAYHLSTLYHAARAARWELAEYEAEELEETLEEAEAAFPTYAPLLQQYRRDALHPLRRATVTHDLEQFRTTFRTAVQGCNNCHVATRRPFIIIPDEPPQLSIFALPPVGN